MILTQAIFYVLLGALSIVMLRVAFGAAKFQPLAPSSKQTTTNQ